jgi:hypothetical protein
LCEIISNLAIKNQVVIATHSGEVLQHFISQANIILLSKGIVEYISDPDQMRKVLEEIGLPIDPSVFTAHWICAENEPSKTLPGGGATTPETLGWIFGKDLKKRYWSFGSSRVVAEAYGTGIATAGTSGLKIDVTPIHDGDKLIKNGSDYAMPTIPEPEKNLAYFPFWEIENIFLSKELLDEIIPTESSKTGSVRFWDLMEENKELLLKTIKKTIAKNNLKQYRLDDYILSDPVKNINEWKLAIQSATVDLDSIDTVLDKVISSKNWQWIPGKEALGLCVAKLSTDFWVKVRALEQNVSLKSVFEKNPLLKEFIFKINSL